MKSEVAMRVIGLHRVPFDDTRFEQDCDLPGSRSREEMAAWREQMRENWNNAWLVVVEFEGCASDIEWREFGQGAGKPESRQAPWLEQVFEDTQSRSLVAFFLHYVDRNLPLWYGETALSLPEETAGDAQLLRRMEYCSPD